MSTPIANLPASPLNIGMQLLNTSGTVQTGTITLTTPTVDTLITGLTASVTVPSIAQFIRATVELPSVTVSAAATITLSIYSGATSGTLTTLLQAITFVTATGQTTVGGTYTFVIPVSNSAIAANNLLQGGTSFLSASAKASTGNFVVNGTSTFPANVFFENL